MLAMIKKSYLWDFSFLTFSTLNPQLQGFLAGGVT